jgi:hypothetical protein
MSIELFSEEQMQNFTLLKKEYNDIKTTKSKKYVLRYRRKIRSMLFKIRKHILLGHPIDERILNSGLLEWIEHQFNANRQQNWETFTFTWDVAVNDPFLLIEKQEWTQTGGTFDDDGFRVPPGFTEQEV